MKILTTSLALLIILNSCSTNSSGSFWDSLKSVEAADFDSPQEGLSLSPIDAEVTETEEWSSKGNKGLKLQMKRDEARSGVELVFSNPLDVSGLKDLTMVFEANNIGEHSAHLYSIVTSDQGVNMRRSASIAPGETTSLYFQLEGEFIKDKTDFRDYPDPWNSGALPMRIRGLMAKNSYDKITSIQFYIQKTLFDKTIIIDNVRFVETPDVSPDYLTNVIDKYGQPAGDFEGKITTDEQLKQLADEELAQLENEGRMAGRSKFGGWVDGPKFDATGYFRTEKIEDKWALIDPEGHVFFSSGLANVRLANTTTFTGRDFKDDTVRWRDPEDVTPEDSRGMVALSDEVTSTSYVSYPWRYQVFAELPSYDDPLANHFSYRREQHIGPFDHGETFSFYQANLERRYGEPAPGAHLEKWVDVTVDRFLNWGFTSFGNWAGYEFFHLNRMPYFANGWIIGDFNTVKSGMDYWGPMPDVFDPEFARRVKVTVDVVAQEVKGNPWCIGVFIDNEKSWGRQGSPNSAYGIVLHGLMHDVTKSPVKRQFLWMLKEKYASIEALNQAWNTSIPSWKEVADGIDYRDKESFTDEMVQDLSDMLFAYADKYFNVVHDALEIAMPNHMYMGCRFATWGLGPEVRRAAKKYVDVFSINYYEEGIGQKYWEFLDEIDKPAIIGEWHIGTHESGLYHPGVVHASDRDDRAKMYKDYLQSVLDNPYMVGAHWFQYIDSPTTGRAHDGENYNVGFVTTADVPYPKLVQAVKEIHSDIYENRYDK